MQKFIICTLTIVLVFCFFLTGNAQNQLVVSNPINLNYRFQFDDPGYREAADPVCENFNGKYYLFASKSGGYWSSPNLAEWTYIPCNSIETMENYAPTILLLDDEMYFMASWEPVKIYKTKNPDTDNWQLIDTKFHFPLVGTQDPAFFKDDDGKVYMYWGCSDKDPIIGVEIDPKDGFKIIGEAVVLIEHHSDQYGWEIPGPNNDQNKDGYNEGPCVNKYKGKYYLQYAAPGTEYRIYGDGVYVGDKPLGPFRYMENSPYSFKPGGFIGGAGHGHTFQDKYGNYWHIATMSISVRHIFERRLGLFPTYFSKDNDLYAHTVWTDYPFQIPDEAVDFTKTDLFLGWNLLSYNKQATASSSLNGYEPEKANDEKVETWWAAQTGHIGEWWQTDLGKTMDVNAIQINFADQDFTTRAPHSQVYYQYVVAGSTDGINWTKLIDRSQNTQDAPHELIVLEQQAIRFLRISNTQKLEGKFSLSGFRVFGKGKGSLPQKVSNFKVQRDSEDARIFRFQWDKQENTTGYILHWGVKENQLNNAIRIYENKFEGRFFNRESNYYFSIGSFNENGVVD
jgi:hypothetical protein